MAVKLNPDKTMRDPKRINPILQKFEKVWNQYPDIRFGQLVFNLLSNSKCKNMFYIEDTDFEIILDNIINDNQKELNNQITFQCSCCKKYYDEKHIVINKDGKNHMCFDCY